MKRNKKEQSQVEEKILGRDEILGECKALPTMPVAVDGFAGKIRMKNLTYDEIVNLRANAENREEYQALLIAEVCVDLSIEDAITLQSGNGFKFLALYEAINKYLNNDLGDEAIKK